MKIKTELLKELRKAKGLTQKEIAERLGITEATVSRYEGGQITKASSEILIGYSKIFNVPISDLCDRQETDWADYLSEESLLDPRVAGFLEYVSERSKLKASGELMLTEEEIVLVRAYRTADSKTKQIVNCALETK